MNGLVVVVLAYRAIRELSEGSLKSIVEATRRVPGPARVVVLDNYSRDGSIQYVQRHHRDVDLLMAPRNLFYCAGNNILMQYAHHRYRPEFFVLADADNFAEPDAYRELVAFARQHPECGIVQPLVRSRRDPTLIYSCGHSYNEAGQCRPLSVIPLDESVLLNLPSCSISSTLVRTEVFIRCGILNPIFEIYFESSDLSFRARRAGYRCACHLCAVTTNEGTEADGLDSFHHRYYFNRNRLIFWRLHDPARFAEVRARSLATYRDLQAELEASPFGLDASGESIRRGLEAGLDISERPELLATPPVSIADYDKRSAVLVHEGGVIEPYGP
jgi:GT2 family glycosyltransferase